MSPSGHSVSIMPSSADCLTRHSLLSVILGDGVQQREPAINHAGTTRAKVSQKTMIYKLAATLNALLKRLKAEEKYRPERHYMRGPGPKARAVSADQRRG